MADNISCEK